MNDLLRTAERAERIMTESVIPGPARVGATISVADTLKAGEARRACVHGTLTRKAGGVWALTGASVGHAHRPQDERRTRRVHVSRRAVAGIPSAVLHPLVSVS